MTKPVTRAQAVDCLLDRANRAGHPILCPECGEPCLPGQKIQFDHIHADKLDGPHEYGNLRPLHYDPCHKRKSKKDVGAMAKIDRITGVTGNGPKAKIRSRGFRKDVVSRGFDGKIRKRES